MATEQSNPSQCGGKEMLGVMLKQVCTAASGMALAILLGGVATTAQQKTAAGEPGIDMQWGVKVPARDGVKLNATVFTQQDRKSTRLNSSHDQISYAVF